MYGHVLRFKMGRQFDILKDLRNIKDVFNQSIKEKRKQNSFLQ